MRNRLYGGVRGRKTKVGRKLLRFPPTRFYPSHNQGCAHFYMIELVSFGVQVVRSKFAGLIDSVYHMLAWMFSAVFRYRLNNRCACHFTIG